jgi:hypothetical protein
VLPVLGDDCLVSDSILVKVRTWLSLASVDLGSHVSVVIVGRVYRISLAPERETGRLAHGDQK